MSAGTRADEEVLSLGQMCRLQTAIFRCRHPLPCVGAAVLSMPGRREPAPSASRLVSVLPHPWRRYIRSIGQRTPFRQPVVDFVRLVAAYLAERMLDLVGMLSGCNAIGIQAVEVPAGPGACRAFIAPATDAGRRRFFPPGRAAHKASGMLCRMPPVVQHQSLELPASDWSLHGSPLLLKLPVIAR